MADIRSNRSPGFRIGNGRNALAKWIANTRREISRRLLERRIHAATMQELWDMPDAYRLELGIDPWAYERLAREQARREAARSIRAR